MSSKPESKPSRLPRLVFFFPTWEVSGVSTVNFLLAEGFAEKGYHCEVVGTDLNQDDPPVGLIPDGVRHRRLTAKPLRRSILGFRRLALMRAQRLIDRGLFEMIHDDVPTVLVPGFELGWTRWANMLPTHVFVLGIIHADDPWWYEAAELMSRHSSRLVAVSRRVQDELRHKLHGWNGQIKCIPNGVKCRDLLQARFRPPGAPLRLIYAGRLVEKQKRVSRIPKLLQALNEHGVPFQMEIAGQGPEETWLREACELMVKSGCVTFLGRLQVEQVREACRRADVFVLLSDYEGLPMGLLEAMAEGCVPMVSAGLSGVEELVIQGINGIVVNADDSVAQAESLALLAISPEDSNELGRAARNSVMHGVFSMERMIQAYQQIVDDLSGSESSPEISEVLSPRRLPVF